MRLLLLLLLLLTLQMLLMQPLPQPSEWKPLKAAAVVQPAQRRTGSLRSSPRRADACPASAAAVWPACTCLHRARSSGGS